ncbi:MAG: hypothetical protein U0794_06880 [Isosphaeraceae bacterium]
MKTKPEIVKDWLPRYLGRPLAKFGSYVLLTNFVNYVDRFAEKFGVEVLGRDRPMQSAWPRIERFSTSAWAAAWPRR